MAESDDRDDLNGWIHQQDEAALSRLCGRYAGMIRQACVRLGSPDPDDATQAVLLVLARKGGRVQPQHLAAWLLTTARRTVSCQRRAFERRRRHEIAAARVAATAATTSTAAPSDLLPLLDEALLTLTANSREAVIRFHLMGQTQQDIAHALGCSESAVKMRVYDGLKALRRALARRGVTTSSAAVVAHLDAQHHAALALAPPPDQVVTACLHPTAATIALVQTVATTAVTTIVATIVVGVSMLLASLALVATFTAAQAPAEPPPAVVAQAEDHLARILDRHIDLVVDEVPVTTAVGLLVARSRLPIYVGSPPGAIPEEPPSASYHEPLPVVTLAMHDQPVRVVLDRIASNLGWHWEQRRQAVALVPPVSDVQRAALVSVLHDTQQPYWRRKRAFQAGWNSGDTGTMELALDEALHAKLAGLRSIIDTRFLTPELQARDIYVGRVPEDPEMVLLRLLRAAPEDQVLMQGMIAGALEEMKSPIDPEQAAAIQTLVDGWKSNHPGLVVMDSGGSVEWIEIMRHYQGKDLDALMVSIFAISKDSLTWNFVDSLRCRVVPQVVPLLSQLLRTGAYPFSFEPGTWHGQATVYDALACLLHSAPEDAPELHETVLTLVADSRFDLSGRWQEFEFQLHPRLSFAMLQRNDIRADVRSYVLDRMDRPADLAPIWRLAEAAGDRSLAQSARDRLVAWGLGDAVRQRCPQPKAPYEKAAWCVMLARGGTAALRQPLLDIIRDLQEPWQSFQNVAWMGITDPVITRALIQVATNDQVDAYRRRDASWQLGGTVPEVQALVEDKAQHEPDRVVREGYLSSLPHSSPRAWSILTREATAGIHPILRVRVFKSLAEGWPGFQSTHDLLRQLVATPGPIAVNISAAIWLQRIERSHMNNGVAMFPLPDERAYQTLNQAFFQPAAFPQPVIGRSDTYDWLVTASKQKGTWVVVFDKSATDIRALWHADHWSSEDGIRLLTPSPRTVRTPPRTDWHPETLLIDLRNQQAPRMIGMDDQEVVTRITRVEQPDPAQVALAGRLAQLEDIPSLDDLQPAAAPAVAPQGAGDF